jgi:hypothetical protein
VGTSAPVLPPGFVEDRVRTVEGGLSIERILRDAPAEREQVRAKLDLLDVAGGSAPTEVSKRPRAPDPAGRPTRRGDT